MGKVHIVTGGYAGCGYELCKIFYQKNANVYVAGRSKDKASKAIASIQKEFPNSTGKIVFLEVDLANLASIKPAAEQFMSKESRLDTLTNNAGVMVPPIGSTDSHGHEQQMGTNCLGPYLLSESLVPILERTAATAPKDSVRVTWAGSLAIDAQSPKGGVQFDAAGTPKIHGSKWKDYGQSKAGNYLLASEFANHHAKSGIVSVSWNPGNLRSELQRHLPKIQAVIMDWTLLYDTKFGAYTELYSACSQEITSAQNGAFVAPWGRIMHVRNDIVAGTKTEAEGGSGTAEMLWRWCEKESAPYK
ncbi:NAD(P)-binding protein [Venturia nashicola]|nr:NAD(P)-binding protein [Venturia nashicola]